MRFICRGTGWLLLAVALQAFGADTWQHITKENQPLLPGDEIQLLKPGPGNGQIWVGTLTGAAKIEGGVLRPLKQAKDLKVWDITARPEGGFWIGHGAGALLVDGDRTVEAMKGLAVATIQVVGTQLWAIAKNESADRNVMMRAQGEEWVPVAGLKDCNVLDLTRDSKGTFWAVLDGDGVMEIDPAKSMSEFRHHLQRLNVTSIITDSKGDTWCGLMSEGVIVRHNGDWKRHLDAERSAVLSIAEGGDGKIWAATSGNGVWVFDGKEWKGMLQDEGAVNILKVTSDKRVWVSTRKRGGLRYWNGSEWQDSLDTPLPLRCLAELPNVAIVAGGVLDGLYILGNYSIKGE